MENSGHQWHKVVKNPIKVGNYYHNHIITTKTLFSRTKYRVPKFLDFYLLIGDIWHESNTYNNYHMHSY